jgi:hypothetical protein
MCQYHKERLGGSNIQYKARRIGLDSLQRPGARHERYREVIEVFIETDKGWTMAEGWPWSGITGQQSCWTIPHVVVLSARRAGHWPTLRGLRRASSKAIIC